MTYSTRLISLQPHIALSTHPWNRVCLQCLSILNYFRSLERTLTINDEGLSLEGQQSRAAGQQGHRKNVMDGSTGGGGGIGSHHYMHFTPAHYK